MKEITKEKRKSRFSGLPWAKDNEDKYIFIGGAGGIGSWTALLLHRAGFSIFSCDFDTVEEHNLGGQFFNVSNIGQTKVAALKDNLTQYNGIDDHFFPIDGKIEEHYNGNSIFISIAAFDNMSARESMYLNWKKSLEYKPDSLFIDARLNAEFLQVLCVTKDRIEDYERDFYPDPNFTEEDEDCSIKQTSHCAAMIGSVITGFCTNFMSRVNDPEAFIEREVPFLWQYEVPFVKTKKI